MSTLNKVYCFLYLCLKYPKALSKYTIYCCTNKKKMNLELFTKIIAINKIYKYGNTK